MKMRKSSYCWNNRLNLLKFLEIMLILKNIHSIVAYLFIISTIAFILMSLIGAMKKNDFTKKNMSLARLAFIASHIQLVLGFILWWTHGYAQMLSENMKEVMSDKSVRLLAVEHPMINILAIAILTIGFISIKKSSLDSTKHIKGIIYYGIALLLILSRIPYQTWLSL